MKVAYRLSSLGFGGAEQVFLSVARDLSRRLGWQADFVVDREDGEMIPVARDEGFTVHALQASRTVTSILPLARYLDAEKPDVMISAYTDTNAAAALSRVMARHKPRLILSEHSSLDDHWQQESPRRKLMLEAMVRYAYRLADQILTVSDGIRGQVADRMKGTRVPIETIYNPVRFTPAATSSPHRPPGKTILAVGRIAFQKDYLTLLQAFVEVQKVHPDARLVIVGGVYEPDEKARMDQFIQAHGLAGSITLAGFTHDVASFYRQGDVFVLSSRWEGFGNVIVEAMAFGLPVVSTDCRHGPREILDNGRHGELVPVADPVALGARLAAVLSRLPIDPAPLLARAQDFSEEKIAAQYERVMVAAAR